MNAVGSVLLLSPAAMITLAESSTELALLTLFVATSAPVFKGMGSLLHRYKGGNQEHL